jgi:hypothetical protein
MSNMMLQTIYNSIYFWILIGALVAVLFAASQQHTIKKTGVNDSRNLLAKTMLQSALRILITVAVLFLAFRTNLSNGIGCLAGFITIRWLWLFTVIKEQKNQKKEEN